MPKQENQIKYWRDRAKRAEETLKREEWVNSFMIGWLKSNHPKIHAAMCFFQEQRGKLIWHSRAAKILSNSQNRNEPLSN